MCTCISEIDENGKCLDCGELQNISERFIVVRSCSVCPNVDHKGAFGQVSYIPCCSAMGNRELPYAPVIAVNKIVTARGTGIIPDWCPLEKRR